METSIQDRFSAVAQRLRDFRPSAFAGPASAAIIAEAEAELGVTFPVSYKLFLREFSGGGFPYDIYGVDPEVEPVGRDWYFWNVVGMTQSEREEVEPRLPPCLIAFHTNGMGDHWCLNTSQLVDGECPVVFWNHERNGQQELKPTHATFLDWLVEKQADRELNASVD